MDAETFLASLCEIHGIGKWTAQYVAMRALGEPDAFPWGDLGLLRALGLGSTRELVERAEPWRPWRAYAAMYLWNGANAGTRRENHSAHKSRSLRAERCAPVSSSIPVRNAQNIRLTEIAKGPPFGSSQ